MTNKEAFLYICREDIKASGYTHANLKALLKGAQRQN